MDQEEPRFQNDGVDVVRLKLHTGGYNLQWSEKARDWLADQDRLVRERNERSQAKQYRTARIAKNAAIVAAIAAVIAIPLAIVAILISLR